MEPLLTIGDFSRATHLSVKALRHYHDVGLLSPFDVDPNTGYRFYSAAQLEAAQLIRHLRKLEMPVEQVKAVLGTSNMDERNEIIVAHLKHMEAQLENTRLTVALLRAMLEPKTMEIAVEHRFVPAVMAAAISEIVDLGAMAAWWAEAFQEIYAALRAQGETPAGPGSGLFATEVFSEEIGESLIFVPISKAIAQSGRVRVMEIPAVEAAVAVHRGPLSTAGPSYAALGKYVAEHAIGADGPIRECYLEMTGMSNDDVTRTEIFWPILTLP